MSIGFGQILLILVGVLMVFGAGRLPTVMADLAKGIRAFKKGLTEEENLPDQPTVLTHDSSSTDTKAPAENKHGKLNV